MPNAAELLQMLGNTPAAPAVPATPVQPVQSVQQAAPGQLSADQMTQMLASQIPAPAPGTAPAPVASRSLVSQFGRQLGLTGRDIINGVTGLGDLPNVAVNAGIRGINNVAGTHIDPLMYPSQMINHLEDKVGLPNPETTQEKYVNAAATNMAGLFTGFGAGNLMTGALSPTTRAVGAVMQQAPGLQAVGAAGGAMGAEAAKDAGLNPAWQMGASIAGGLGAGGTAALTQRAFGPMAGSVANAGRQLSPQLDALAEALAPGSGRMKLTPDMIAAQASQGIDSMLPQAAPDAIRPAAPMTDTPPTAPLTSHRIPPRLRQDAAPTAPGVGAVPFPLQPAPGDLPALSPGDVLHQQVVQMLLDNPNASPVAVARRADFRNLGIDPTLGQITRDPMQYARERNLRGLEGVGEPLTNRFVLQNTQLQNQMGALAGQPSTAYEAGTKLITTLNKIDGDMQANVAKAYTQAKGSTEARMDVPMETLAQDYANVLHDYGDKVPSGVRNNFNQYGLLNGTQNKIFTMEHADNLLKVINANRSSDPATNGALRELRKSVKNAILQADDNNGQFAQARALAAERFQLHDLVPAIEGAGDDAANPDMFIRRYVVNDNTDNVRGLGAVLRQHSPETFKEVRSQLAAHLGQSAFGINAAGDSAFQPASYAKALQQLGPAKLAAFFTPEEISQLQSIGRVGSYINSVPTASAVNFSNSGSALGNIAGAVEHKFPLLGPIISNVKNRNSVTQALAAALGDTQTQLPSSPIKDAIVRALTRGPAQGPN